MRVDDFDFDLPDDLIALRPVSPRDSSRLLRVGGKIADGQFTDLPDLLQAGDVLVLNNTKVLPAALKGQRPPRLQGGSEQMVEVDINLHKAVLRTGEAGECWLAFARPAKRLRPGDELTFGAGLTARVVARAGAEIELAFNLKGAVFERALHKAGAMPLPPYIGRHRELDAQDAQDYQTVFARDNGSVAAPTAGLHFSPEILARLKDKGVALVEVTLHVGAGTFLPVSVADTREHKMHAEWGQVQAVVAEKLNTARHMGGRIVCVGTTSLRLLESAAKSDGTIMPYCDETDIFITPGYEFRAVDVLVTNFHLPRSTLYMLVSAFAGMGQMKNAYAHAIAKGYRFYSYGDACYLERAQTRAD